ncbi:ABC transporter ATP-binding protein [Saccharothrix australiensis]|uniref:ABC-type multidrug transport system fused ATPase/permease subunit n=1 Tax=Saccharothrix australiensis TaxID=2072 RepID=A0A495W4E0_9PSEU|nr:ABC transporter ATP-binding protein [Saccharothrix australiensis]RKT54668.1 ABC-type multidrug transport system fused ATPase/permease subunit [Saccharothrix australiensis]
MTTLPVASARAVRAHARRLVLRHPGALAGAVGLHALAALSGLVSPWLLGNLVEDVGRGLDNVERTILFILLFVVLQAVLLQLATYRSATLGERVLADLREDFVDRVLALPPTTVERAGTGDLVTRMTRDVDALSVAARSAVPDMLIGATTVVIALGALVLVDPLVAFPCLVAVPSLWLAARWYYRRARAGYLRQNATYADLTEGLAETVEGARTVEALRLGPRRVARVRHDIEVAYAAERHTLWLRTVYLPIADVSFVLPVVATLVVGGLFYLNGWTTLAAVTAATLYVQQIIPPLDTLLARLEDLQVGGAALARVLGVADAAEPGPRGEPARPAGADLAVRGVSFAYRPGHDVLHDVHLEVARGERLAIVGASGAGKTTLGRLMAGLERPRTGTVVLGGVDIAEVPRAELRRHVALVTQEHHVFRGTLADNLRIADPDASDEALVAALRAVDAWEWAEPLGLGAELGGTAVALSPAQAQQLSLARLVVADPHTLILDEATSLLDPKAARHLERSLAAVLEGRTVIAIAHRLLTAHDADRVVVMDGGRITEIGPHDELVAGGGAYAALWESWHGRSAPV